MNWQMIGATAAVVVPVAGLIVGLIVMSINRQIDLVNRRFDSVDRQFVSVDRQLEAVDRQFVSVNEQLASVNQRLASADRQFDVLGAENRAAHERIGANVDGLCGDVAALRATVDALLLKLVPEGEARR